MNIPIQSPISHTLLYLEAGARHEPINYFGCSHVLTHTIFNVKIQN